MMVCAQRARASSRPSPVCSDPWAARLAGSAGEEMADRAGRNMELWIACRTAWLDERVRRLVDEGRRQVVMLGAGLDTRAARLGQGMSGVSWYEVDHPKSQEVKLERLSELASDGYPLKAAKYVGCDFEQDDFIEKLESAGFDVKGKPSVFVWEGVTMWASQKPRHCPSENRAHAPLPRVQPELPSARRYLTEPAVRSSVRRISEACHPSTVLLFDHVGSKMVRAESNLDEEGRVLHGLVREVGEPFRFGINDPLPFLVDAGFAHVRSTSFDEICLGLTGSYERERMFRFQHIVEASKGHRSRL